LSTTKSHTTRPGLEPQTAVVGNQLLTAWAMAWPNAILLLRVHIGTTWRITSQLMYKQGVMTAQSVQWWAMARRLRFHPRQCYILLPHSVQNNSEACPASYPTGTRGCFCGTTTAGAWS
jgi:hypothetical protein